MRQVGSDKAVVLSLTAINDATAEKLQVPIEQKTTSVQSQRLSINLWDEDAWQQIVCIAASALSISVLVVREAKTAGWKAH